MKKYASIMMVAITPLLCMMLMPLFSTGEETRPAEPPAPICDTNCQLATEIVGTNQAIERNISASETAIVLTLTAEVANPTSTPTPAPTQ